MFSLMGDVVGSAVVFFHKQKEQRPLCLVRAMALTDLQPCGAEGAIREKTVCRARILDKWWPCLVVEIEESRQLSEQIIKVYREEYHLEKRGVRLSEELGLRSADGPMTVDNGRAESPEVYAPLPAASHHGSDRSFASASTAYSPRKFPSLSSLPAGLPRSAGPRGRRDTGLPESSDDDVKEVALNDEQEIDLIQKSFTANFLRRGLPPLKKVPPPSKKVTAGLAALPKRVWSPRYKEDITVTELRDAMWQCDTWHAASKGALRCIYTFDELKEGVPNPAGAAMRNKKLLEQSKLSVIFEISKEMCREHFDQELTRREFGKHVGTHKSCLRRELGLPPRYKRPHVKSASRKKRRSDHEEEASEMETEDEEDAA
ncbi:hypothetical protein RvY_18802 [Ramazzottius varieornatus]|uniref:Uncharacterized protein n=1 Tax=Ramazzottius varieornatus TaxID=947166 RepID=A0A1D1WA02_RAMVA|nr:hypothetical protein RvY_18802 [Ramazzottius varieornatus]